MRSLACLSVVWLHCRSVAFGPTDLSRMFSLYVNSFFFIGTGLLLGKALLEEISKKGKIVYRDFIGRRVLRVLPLYYFYLIIYIIFVDGFDYPWLRLFLLNNYVRSRFFGQSWTLAIDEQIYILLPFLVWVGFRLGSSSLWMGGLLVLFSIFRFALGLESYATDNLIFWIDFFITGIGLASLSSGSSLLPRWIEKWPNSCSALGLVAFLIVVTFRSQLYYAYITFIAIACALTLMPFLCELHFSRRLMKSEFLGRFAHLTFGVYLAHMLFVLGTAAVLKPLEISGWPLVIILFGTTLTLSLISAYCTYSLIEKPMNILRYRLFSSDRSGLSKL